MSKLSQIEQKIKEVCPWLMKLEFGCVIDVNGTPRTVYKVDRQGDVFTLLGESQFIISKETVEFSRVITIIGKEPQLSDLLYTIGKVHPNRHILFNSEGQLVEYLAHIESGEMGLWYLTEGKPFDLTKSLRENLENEELCDFIHQLICK